MEVNDNLAYRIHRGLVSSSDSDSDDIDGKNDFDELYNSLKPPPFDYESIKDRIVVIPQKENVEVLHEKCYDLWAEPEKCEVFNYLTATSKKKKKKKSKQIEAIATTSETYTVNALLLENENMYDLEVLKKKVDKTLENISNVWHSQLDDTIIIKESAFQREKEKTMYNEWFKSAMSKKREESKKSETPVVVEKQGKIKGKKTKTSGVDNNHFNGTLNNTAVKEIMISNTEAKKTTVELNSNISKTELESQKSTTPKVVKKQGKKKGKKKKTAAIESNHFNGKPNSTTVKEITINNTEAKKKSVKINSKISEIKLPSLKQENVNAKQKCILADKNRSGHVKVTHAVSEKSESRKKELKLTWADFVKPTDISQKPSIFVEPIIYNNHGTIEKTKTNLLTERYNGEITSESQTHNLEITECYNGESAVESPEPIFNEEFKSFLQDMDWRDKNTAEIIKSFTYEQFHRAYKAYLQKQKMMVTCKNYDSTTDQNRHGDEKSNSWFSLQNSNLELPQEIKEPECTTFEAGSSVDTQLDEVKPTNKKRKSKKKKKLKQLTTNELSQNNTGDNNIVIDICKPYDDSVRLTTPFSVSVDSENENLILKKFNPAFGAECKYFCQNTDTEKSKNSNVLDCEQMQRACGAYFPNQNFYTFNSNTAENSPFVENPNLEFVNDFTRQDLVYFKQWTTNQLFQNPLYPIDVNLLTYTLKPVESSVYVTDFWIKSIDWKKPELLFGKEFQYFSQNTESAKSPIITNFTTTEYACLHKTSEDVYGPSISSFMTRNTSKNQNEDTSSGLRLENSKLEFNSQEVTIQEEAPFEVETSKSTCTDLQDIKVTSKPKKRKKKKTKQLTIIPPVHNNTLNQTDINIAKDPLYPIDVNLPTYTLTPVESSVYMTDFWIKSIDWKKPESVFGKEFQYFSQNPKSAKSPIITNFTTTEYACLHKTSEDVYGPSISSFMTRNTSKNQNEDTSSGLRLENSKLEFNSQEVTIQEEAPFEVETSKSTCTDLQDIKVTSKPKKRKKKKTKQLTIIPPVHNNTLNQTDINIAKDPLYPIDVNLPTYTLTPVESSVYMTDFWIKSIDWKKPESVFGKEFQYFSQNPKSAKSPIITNFTTTEYACLHKTSEDVYGPSISSFMTRNTSKNQNEDTSTGLQLENSRLEFNSQEVTIQEEVRFEGETSKSTCTDLQDIKVTSTRKKRKKKKTKQLTIIPPDRNNTLDQTDINIAKDVKLNEDICLKEPNLVLKGEAEKLSDGKGNVIPGLEKSKLKTYHSSQNYMSTVSPDVNNVKESNNVSISSYVHRDNDNSNGDMADCKEPNLVSKNGAIKFTRRKENLILSSHISSIASSVGESSMFSIPSSVCRDNRDNVNDKKVGTLFMESSFRALCENEIPTPEFEVLNETANFSKKGSMNDTVFTYEYLLKKPITKEFGFDRYNVETGCDKSNSCNFDRENFSDLKFTSMEPPLRNNKSALLELFVKLSHVIFILMLVTWLVNIIRYIGLLISDNTFYICAILLFIIYVKVFLMR